MVYDEAAQKYRDVDITITFKNQDGTISAFKAAEVKKEANPLDVATIEQLCMKFSDMPQITHRSIFSTSGYSKAAKVKAEYYLVDIYTLRPWKRRIEDDFPDFSGTGFPSEFLPQIEACILRWVQYNVRVVASGGPASFSWYNDTPIFASNGAEHNKYANMGQYIVKAVRRSADILCTLEPMFSIAEDLIHSTKINAEYSTSLAFDHSHSMDVNKDQIYLKLEGNLYQISFVTIYGKLQWSLQKRIPEFYILENAITHEIFSGAAIADYGENDGRMFAMIFPEKGRELGIHRFSIPEKQKNIIHNMKIKG